MFIEWIWEGLEAKWIFCEWIVSEVIFEKLLKVLCFAYVFENG